MIKAYLAGPDVFLRDAADNARRKIALCAQYGMIGLAPLDEAAGPGTPPKAEAQWSGIFNKDIAMMEASDIIIANLTPFRGASADAGTLVELGWFLGRGKPIFGYSNSGRSFAQRSKDQVESSPDPLPGLVIEPFGLPDNLMIAGAILAGGGGAITLPEPGQEERFDSLAVFERCVRHAASVMAGRP